MALAHELPQTWPVPEVRASGSRKRSRATGGASAVLTPDSQGRLEVVESQRLDEARLDGVRLAAREMAHLLNNDLAVAFGLVELLHERRDLPAHLRNLLAEAVDSLDAVARHIEDFQGVVRVAVKDTPAGLVPSTWTSPAPPDVTGTVHGRLRSSGPRRCPRAGRTSGRTG